jgi:hypothetical protein
VGQAEYERKQSHSCFLIETKDSFRELQVSGTIQDGYSVQKRKGKSKGEYTLHLGLLVFSFHPNLPVRVRMIHLPQVHII